MPVDLKLICKIHRNKWPKQSWITIKSENFHKFHMKIEFFEVFSPKYETDRCFSVHTFRYGIVYVCSCVTWVVTVWFCSSFSLRFSLYSSLFFVRKFVYKNHLPLAKVYLPLENLMLGLLLVGGHSSFLPSFHFLHCVAFHRWGKVNILNGGKMYNSLMLK